MPGLISDFFAYLKEVFVESQRLVFTAFDVLGIGLLFYPYLAESLTDNLMYVRIIGGGIFLVSFLLANFTLYRRMAHDAIIPYKADIQLVRVEESDFSPSYPGVSSPFPEIQRSPHGLNDQGVPDWGAFWARIKVANVGYEDGQLALELDRAKTNLPPPFDCERVEVRFPVTKVSGRSAFSADFYFDILFTAENPHSFAVAVKDLVKAQKRYQISLKYWTERVDGESNVRRFNFKGDFKSFHQNTLKRWSDLNFTELVKLAEFT
jgi:hypothetical protein